MQVSQRQECFADMRESKSLQPKPFLRWVGGKTRLVDTLEALAPKDINGGTYWEPCLGAGSLFFALVPQRAVLSDLNSDLVSTFKAVRSWPLLVASFLEDYARQNSEDYYYKVRDWYNQKEIDDSTKRAAAFIYLNKTCFNGIWRVNKKGEFNVPYGHKEPPALPSREELVTVSRALQSAVIRSGDFRQVLKDAGAGDFIYIDPPYPPLNGTAYFTHYTRDRFGKDDQEAIAEIVRALDKRSCKVLVSNADLEFIHELYEGFRILQLKAARSVNASGKRQKVSEVAILNYDPEYP